MQPGNTFQVQMRIEPEFKTDSAVSIITEVAVQVGSDRVTFSPSRAQAPGSFANPVYNSANAQIVWVDGVAATISRSNPVLPLSGGTVTEVSANDYRVVLNTGEVVDIKPFGDGIGLSIGLGQNDGAGSVQGFLGASNGRSNDFQLPDGTVLQQPLTQKQLYQTFANAWRVTDATSLLDYAPSQSTATFTNSQYPREVLTLADLPANLVAKAATLAAAAGITDPTLAADAEFDYITMGDPSYFTEDPAVAAVNPTVPTPATITDPVTPPPSVGIAPSDPLVVESTGAITTVSYVVNLTSAATTDTVVDYAVVTPTGTMSGKDFLTAADFGGTLPSGSVTVAAGQTEATVTVAVPNSALSAAPDKWLMLAITAAGDNPVYDPAGQVEIMNNAPVAGPAPSFAVELVDDETVIPTVFGNTWTLKLPAITPATASSTGTLTLAVLNDASLDADSLSGTITATGNGGIATTVIQRFDNIAPSALAAIAVIDLASSSLVGGTETFTIALTESNATGYSASLPTETVIVQNPAALLSPPVINAPASATLIAGTATAISGVSLSEIGSTSDETFTVTLTDTSGLLSATGTGVQGAGSTALTITGPLAQVNADLSTLQDTDATTPSDTITLNATDSLGNSAAPAQIAITVQTIGGTSPTQPGQPVITAPASATVTAGTATAISGVSIDESGNIAGELFTVTLIDTNGLLSATGTGVQASGSTALSITGSLSQVNADLATLKDTDASTASDIITLNATDSLGNSATPAQIAVTVQTIGGTSPTQPGKPAITAPASATVTAGAASAISGVSIDESGSITGELFTVTLTDTDGLLSATGTGVQGFGSTGLTITGSLSDVNADLATLQDTDATTPSDTITLNATDSLGNSATPAQIAITMQTMGGTSPTQPGGTATGSGNSPGNSTPVASAPVYRFFDSHTGTQFLTSNPSERDNVMATRPDLISEGVGLQAVVPAAGDTTATPIYRFFDTLYGTHFYTSNGSERDTIVATRPDLTYEGIGFYEYATQQPNSAAVYRFFESTNGTHFYTSSADERANILATRTDLVSEGIAFYAPVST